MSRCAERPVAWKAVRVGFRWLIRLGTPATHSIFIAMLRMRARLASLASRAANSPAGERWVHELSWKVFACWRDVMALLGGVEV
jgi:hypothetical protein